MTDRCITFEGRSQTFYRSVVMLFGLGSPDKCFPARPGIWRAAATDKSSNLCLHTGLVRTDIGSLLEPPVAGLKVLSVAAALRLPGSHAHFAEREQEFGESQAGRENLGLGPQAKIPGLGLETRL